MLQKLDKEKYVSLATERRKAARRLQSSQTTSIEPETGKENRNGVDSYANSEKDYDSNDEADDSTSLFDRKMPGIMTRDEITEKVDLDRIAIKLQQRIGLAQVRYTLFNDDSH